MVALTAPAYDLPAPVSRGKYFIFLLLRDNKLSTTSLLPQTHRQHFLSHLVMHEVATCDCKVRCAWLTTMIVVAARNRAVQLKWTAGPLVRKFQ
jgi:hypothetical protein